MFFKRLLFLSFLVVVCISCSSAKASDSNGGGNQDDQNNPPAPSVPEVSYASQGLMIMDNPSTGFVEVYRSADGKIWDGPAKADNVAEPLVKDIMGTLEQYIVIDNNSMVLSTTYGVYFSGDGWATFRRINGWAHDSEPTKRGIGYVNGNIFSYDSDGLSVCDKKCLRLGAWDSFKVVDPKYPDNLQDRNFKFAGVPVLAK